MERLTYTNAMGKSIEFSVRPDYIMRKIEGTGSVELDIRSDKSYGQDGESYRENSLRPRFLNLELSIIANGRREMADKRKRLTRVLNPKLGLGTIEYEYGGVKHVIKGLPEKSPDFVTGKPGRDRIQEALVYFYCPDPYWKAPRESKAEIARWLPMFEFPLMMPEEGIVMGERQESLIVPVNNRGDVSTGMKIVFRADATVVNPSLFNVNTREYFKIEKTLVAGDQVVVTTGFQNKKVKFIQNGVTSTLHEFDYNSTYMQLEPGDNLFRYDADDGLDNLSVDVYYIQKYLGV